jgi:hypothetical protein
MDIFLFKQISGQIAAKVPEIRQIELFAGQYNDADNEAGLVFPPAVFIEFGEINWEDIGEYVQMGALPVRIHAVTQHIAPFNLNKKPDAMIKYSEKVDEISTKLYAALHGFCPGSEGNITTQLLTRIRSTGIENPPPTLHIKITEYLLEIIDKTAMTVYSKPADEPKIVIKIGKHEETE